MKAELRFLAEGLSVVAGVGFTAALLLFASPWAPGALEGPAALAVAGRSERAMHAYLDVAHGWGSGRTRSEALWRAGQIAALEIGDADQALSAFKELVDHHPGSPRVAEAHAWRGRLLLNAKNAPAEAGRAFQSAATADPDHADAPAWWLAAGRAFHEADDVARARHAFARAAESPAIQVEAWLARGQLELAVDAGLAYEAFSQALQAQPSDQDAHVARLGMATALERMDDMDAALAEVDDALAEDDDPALRRRRDRLRSRLQ